MGPTNVDEATAAEARIKGGVLLARLAFVRKHGGEPTLRQILERLPEGDRLILSGPVLHLLWYPLALNLRLDDAIAQVLSPHDRPAIFLAMGRASADVNLGGPHKPYVHVGDPHHLLKQAGKIYAAYYAVGHRTYEPTGPSSGVLRTFDAESVTETDCLTVVGWHERAIEICGGTGARVVETLCRARRAPHCEYTCSWT